jgi:hypothetical protein
MIKKTFLISIFCAFISLTSFCQAISAEKHPTPAAVLAIPSLKTQAEKIDKKVNEINAAETSSRAIMTQLKEELASLNQEYKILLSNAISTTNDPAVLKALEEEIHFVEQQLEVKTSLIPKL